MAFSKEYTYWHLTPTGWISGDSKTDFNSWDVDTPKDTVLTIKYSEEMTHGMGEIKKYYDRFNEIEDKEKLIELERKFPFNPYIKVY